MFAIWYENSPSTDVSSIRFPDLSCELGLLVLYSTVKGFSPGFSRLPNTSLDLVQFDLQSPQLVVLGYT